jgi:hypothetical protein
LLWPEILERNAAPAPECCAGFGDSAKELRVVLQPVVEPVVFCSESDQDARRLSVPRDDDLLSLGQAQESRQVILDLSQRRLAYRPSRGRQASWPLGPS